MELILINESKLKIMLSPGDMQQYEINCDTVDYGNTETRRAFWNLLDEAKHLTGFDAASDRVYIQLYPSREGGCEMYVTKLSLPVSSHNGDLAPACSTEKEFAFSFASLGLLLRVCRQLKASGFSGKSGAYTSDNGLCCLFLSSRDCDALPNCFAFISEFGTETDPSVLRTYTNEYCKCICRTDAVEKLAKLA